MCEVTRSTFDTYFPLIAKAVRAADFVALDTEFTGLRLNEECKPSLFDSSDERYGKLRQSMQQFTMCQIGVSAFINDLNQNRYEVHTFNIFLQPCSYGPVDVCFTCQASCMAFLCKYNFDFNKFMYDGVSYLNNPQEDAIRKCIEDKVSHELNRDVDEHQLSGICSKVAEWFVSSTEGDICSIKKQEAKGTWDEYMIHTEIRNRFPLVWSVTDPFGNISVENVSAEKRKIYEKDHIQSEKQKNQEQLNTLLGFTRVFRVLVDAKKPIVGHNFLCDLLLMYDKFYEPLPAKWKDFKKNLHYLFPKVYDTKHMAFQLRKPLKSTGLLTMTGLHELFLTLESGKALKLMKHAPQIVLSSGSEQYKNAASVHEAGFDSYQCGCVFLRLNHLYMQLDKQVGLNRPVKFIHYTPLLKEFLNRVNVIRAMANHYRLDNWDPPSLRPELLFARMHRSGARLRVNQLASWLSSYGMVDVQLQSSSEALIACGNFACARDILKSFRKHPEVKITKYSRTRHNPTIRKLLWVGSALTTGLCVWIVVSGLKKK